jgi:hypothetical protein
MDETKRQLYLQLRRLARTQGCRTYLDLYQPRADGGPRHHDFFRIKGEQAQCPAIMDLARQLAPEGQIRQYTAVEVIFGFEEPAVSIDLTGLDCIEHQKHPYDWSKPSWAHEEV